MPHIKDPHVCTCIMHVTVTCTHESTYEGYRILMGGTAHSKEVFFVNSSSWLLHTDSLLFADGKQSVSTASSMLLA